MESCLPDDGRFEKNGSGRLKNKNCLQKRQPSEISAKKNTLRSFDFAV